MKYDEASPEADCQNSLADDFPAGTDQRVWQAVEYMEQNLSRPLTVELVAETAGLSSRQLERLFHHYVKNTPAEYFRRLRLRHARWLLRNTAKAIRDIAMECGFTDGSHFTKRYKEYYGHSPSRERSIKELR
ncbi:hypothetical protein C4J81_17965 [Deltaproteobacteria bacterium Smac51]|nr:hypothetical protein C4J81_17965 [Deltaproteobacteria bacterium Smac51]